LLFADEAVKAAFADNCVVSKEADEGPGASHPAALGDGKEGVTEPNGREELKVFAVRGKGFDGVVRIDLIESENAISEEGPGVFGVVRQGCGLSAGLLPRRKAKEGVFFSVVALPQFREGKVSLQSVTLVLSYLCVVSHLPQGR